ncbi:MAG: hypothetical protein WA715_11485 [Candidatus Acidiferrum sp.]
MNRSFPTGYEICVTLALVATFVFFQVTDSRFRDLGIILAGDRRLAALLLHYLRQPFGTANG